MWEDPPDGGWHLLVAVLMRTETWQKEGHWPLAYLAFLIDLEVICLVAAVGSDGDDPVTKF